MLANLTRLLGAERKKLRLPLLLLTLDTLFSMFFYGVMYAVIVNIVHHSLTKEKIYFYTGMMVVAFLLRILINIHGFKGIQIEGARIIELFRLSLGDHIRNLNLGYFNKNNIGNISNILTNDLQELELVITHSTSDLIKTVLLSTYLVIITFTINFDIGAIQLMFIICSMPIILYGGKKVTKIAAKKKVVMNEVIARVVEYLSGMQLFKAYNLAGHKFSRLEKALRNFKTECIRTEIAIVPFVLIFQIVVDISFPVLLLIATSKFTAGTLTQTEFITFIIISIALTNVLRAFGGQYGEFRYLRLAVDKLTSVYDQPAMPFTQESVKFNNYDVTFKDVFFKYGEEKGILKGVDFTAKEGTMTALIGSSGSGKTTITNLIARFWDIQKGSITIGDYDIRDVKPDRLLDHISMVFQDVYLLHDTVLNNIKIGNPNATKNQVIEAAQKANCHEFIMEMEKGYDTMIGEGGSTISGGEKQRISIARAILKDAPIILLDEATASLDADNEMEIRKSINHLMKNKTVIVIAHRLYTIKDAHQIILLDDGKIIEKGSHDSLMRLGSRYHKMYTDMLRAKEWELQ